SGLWRSASCRGAGITVLRGARSSAGVVWSLRDAVLSFCDLSTGRGWRQGTATSASGGGTCLGDRSLSARPLLVCLAVDGAGGRDELGIRRVGHRQEPDVVVFAVVRSAGQWLIPRTGTSGSPQAPGSSARS